MSRHFCHKAILLCFSLFISLPVYSQQIREPKSTAVTEQSKHPKIGLALSGGGAKGFAHIGMLKVFEEEGIPIDMVSGASMGAIVGSLYAVGYTPNQIKQIATSSDWSILFNDRYRINLQNISNSVSTKNTYLLTFPFKEKSIQLPFGLIDGQNISMLFYRLMLPYHNVHDFTKLPVPFAAVATNLATGQAHTFTHGYLPDAVRASTAIPSIFEPVTINDTTYIDGGIARGIPVKDARNLGADLVIACDVGEPVKPLSQLHTFLDVMNQSIGFGRKQSDIKQIKKADFYIRPDIEEFSSFSYDQADEIIKRGEEAARKIIPALKAKLKERTRRDSISPSISSTKDDTLLISDVALSNIDGLKKRQVELALNIHPPVKLTLSQVESKINRLYGTGFFSQISYRFLDAAKKNNKRLVLKFNKKEQQNVGFGARYDSQYKAALLFGITLADNFFLTDRLTTQLRIGEAISLASHYSVLTSLQPFSSLNLGLNFQHSPIEFYNDGQALSTIDIEQIKMIPSAAVRLFNSVVFEAGIDAEVYNLNEAVGNTLVFENTHFLLNPFLQLKYNSLNRPYFPTRGQSLFVRSQLSARHWGSNATFVQIIGEWRHTIRLLKGVNLTNNVFGGYTSVSTIPLHYQYYLGGFAENPIFNIRQYPFMGYSTQQLRTTNLAGLRSELQFRLSKNIYFAGGWNAAHLSDSWTFNLDKDKMKYGYSLSLGATTIIGPARLSLSTPDFAGGYALKIDVGYHF